MLLPAGFDLSFIDMIKIDTVKSVLYISTAYNKGVGTININIAQIWHPSGFFWIETLVYIYKWP